MTYQSCVKLQRLPPILSKKMLIVVEISPIHHLIVRLKKWNSFLKVVDIGTNF